MGRHIADICWNHCVSGTVLDGHDGYIPRPGDEGVVRGTRKSFAVSVSSSVRRWRVRDVVLCENAIRALSGFALVELEEAAEVCLPKTSYALTRLKLSARDDRLGSP
jgi:hypothetical protein